MKRSGILGPAMWALLATGTFAPGCGDDFSSCADTKTCAPSGGGGIGGGGAMGGQGGAHGGMAGAMNEAGQGGAANQGGAGGASGAVGGTGEGAVAGEAAGGGHNHGEGGVVGVAGSASDAGHAGEAGSNAGAPTPISLITTSLPNAPFNFPYTTKLSASGGSGSGYQWSISSPLPQGLKLARDGTISGKATQSGSFTLTLLISDDAGGTTQASIVLTVTRQRWLGYDSDKKSAGIFLPYLVDLSSNGFSREFGFSNVFGPSCGATQGFAFSPNGKRLAFVAGVGATCAQELFIVDVSSDTPSAPIRADGTTGVGMFCGWSPDSRWLAYFDGSDPGNSSPWTSSVLMADGSDAVPQPPITVAANRTLGMGSWCQWAGPRLAWSDGQSIYSVQNVNGDWQPPANSQASTPLEILASTNDSRIALLQTNTAMTEVNLADGSESISYPLGVFSRDLDFVLVYGNSPLELTPGLYRVSSAMTPLLVSTGQLGTVAWAYSTDRALASAGSDVLFVDATSSPPSSTTLSTSTNHVLQPSFSPDDSLILLASNQDAAIGNVTAAGVSPLKIVSVDRPQNELVVSGGFSPNSSALYYALQASGTQLDVSIVDVSSATPSAPRMIGQTSSSSAYNVGWSFDAAYWYLIDYSTSQLYIANIFDPVGLVQTFPNKVHYLAFQP